MIKGVTFNRQQLADEAASLAVQGVYIGTSSWKYPGWCGMLYDRARYEYRGKFAETRFKRDCRLCRARHKRQNAECRKMPSEVSRFVKTLEHSHVLGLSTRHFQRPCKNARSLSPGR